MRVLHVIPSLSPADGGPSFALPTIAKGLSEAGVLVDVATTMRAGEHLDTADGVNVFSFGRQTEFYKVSIPLSRWLSAHVREYDLVHIHALFSFASCSAAQIAHKRGVPYVVRPLGVLNRWGMEHRRRWLKRLSFQFIERGILHRAAAIHYTSRQEHLEAESLGVRGTAAVIPLGLELSAFREAKDGARFYDRFPLARDRNVILFLSRLDPKKGLDLLLRSFMNVHRQNPKTLLVVAGDGDARFSAGLRELARELEIDKQVLWTGFLGGQEKLAAMAAASVFVLSSYSENFGVAPVEAMAAGVPCVLSDQVGIAADVNEYGAGLVTSCAEEPLTLAILRLIDDAELRSRTRANARRLVEERFSVDAMTHSLVKLYEQVLSPQAVDWLESVAVLGD